MYYLIALLWRQ
jgi:hypothetical protein